MTKILLVEDDKSLREIYGVRLLAEGYDIVSAGDGEEALAMAIKERPSLIVSDVMMPKISGFDMLDILRSTTETKDIKVIMMTALSSEDQRQRGERLGADRYLVKSQVGIEDVVRTVHDVLGDIPGSATATPPRPAAPQPQPTPVAPTQPQPTPQPPVSPIANIPERPSVETLSPQAPAQPQPPVSPITAQPQSTPQPQAQPLPAPQTAQPSGLPQPTAPFSSQAARPSNLGDRVIHPLEESSDDQPDLAKLMEQELSGTGIEPISVTPTHTPAPQPTAPPTEMTTPQPIPQPQAPTAVPVAPQPVQPAPEPHMSQPAQPATQTPSSQPQSQAQPVANPFPPIPPQQ